MNRKHHGRMIDASVRIDTTPLRAWQTWADPEHSANWFVDRAEGIAAPGEVMSWFFDRFNYRMPVPIVEAEPGKTFVTGSGDTPAMNEGVSAGTSANAGTGSQHVVHEPT